MTNTNIGPIPDNHLELARIVGVHGIKGNVILRLPDPKADDLDDILLLSPLYLYPPGKPVEIAPKHRKKSNWVVHLSGINDRNSAEDIIGHAITIEQDRLPDPEENEFYHADLLACRVINQDTGQIIGRITAVENFGAGDILEIELDEPDTLVGVESPLLLPFSDSFIAELDINENKLAINLPDVIIAHPDPKNSG
jgi:16S rRNA processing protein RimM